MTARRAIWEVARRELVERSRSRAMRFSCALVLVFAVGGAVVAARLSDRTPTDDVGFVGARSATVERALALEARAAGRRARVHRPASAAAAAQAVRDGALDVALIDGKRLVVKQSRSGPAVTLVRDAVADAGVYERLRASGLSDAQALATMAPRLPVHVLEPGGAERERNQATVYLGLFGLYMTIVVFGSTVASSVIEEKSSRVVELLLTTLSPRRLMAGKVLGIGLLGLGLLVVAGGGALAAGHLAGGAGLPSAAPKTIALVALWFVLGYAFYSVAYAGVGALVSRQEDLTMASAPVTGVLVAAYVITQFAIANPNGSLAQIAAFVPPFAPMTVPLRVVLGDMGVVGLAAAVAFDLAATAAMVALAARVYERAILHIGAPVKLRSVLALPGRELRLPPGAERIGRGVAVACLAGGVLLGFEHPAGIALVALGLVLVTLVSRRHREKTR